MPKLIHRVVDWARARFSARTPELTVPEPESVPPAQPATSQSELCDVYVWATAHGIDLKPSSPLRTCDCRTHEAVERLSARVAEANRASRRGRGEGGPAAEWP
ncbi:hypothetical protein [Streptomyces sp. NPDC051162]|uniref:hypothetical protein n=1 Tax=unclassified Streptomyces TaxID=2593676 RepID=UPI0034176020